MRRRWIGQLLLLAATCLLTGPSRFARAADSALAGTWKIIYFNQVNELDFWLVKIDKDGKKAELLSTFPHDFFRDNKVADIKSAGDTVEIHFKGPPPRNNEHWGHFHPPKGKDKPTALLGAVRLGVGYDFTPARMEKTEAATINPMNAGRFIGGKADLEAAVKTTDVEDKIKDLEDIIKTYEGKPITFITTQVLLETLVQKKAPAAAFTPVADGYLKSAATYGREIQLQANLNLGRLLTNYDPTKAMGLKYCDQAVKLLADDDNRGVKLQALISQANAQSKNTKDDDVKGTLAKITDIAEDVIKKPRVATSPPALVSMEMGRMLLASTAPLVADAGLEYARRAVKLIKDDTPVPQQLAVYKLLRAGLQSRGKKEEANGVTVTIDKLEDVLDKEYLDQNVTLKPKKYAGRKGKSNRVVVVEMFTNAQAPGCRAPGLAFDALPHTYSPKEVSLIQYHQMLQNAPDPMTNQDIAARAKYYSDDLDGVPTVFVDGKVTDPMAGADKTQVEARYNSLRKLIDDALETDAQASIKLDVARTGDKIEIKGDVIDLKTPGAKVKLHFVLVEQTARFTGNNGLRLHHDVVRALPGGPAGYVLDKKASSHAASVSVNAVRKTIPRFPNMEIPMDLKKLKVIALIQDDDTKRIFQAAQADVPEAKEDKSKEAKKE
jgi:hypothetical protein